MKNKQKQPKKRITGKLPDANFNEKKLPTRKEKRRMYEELRDSINIINENNYEG